MTRFTAVLTLGVTIVAMSGSIASAALPPTVLWQDNFTGQPVNTSISTLGWSAISGTTALTSYLVETALSPPVSVRTYGMNQNAVFSLQQTVTGMDVKTSQWFHIKVHQANGNSASLLDGVRVATSGSCVFYFLIAERQVQAVSESPGGNTNSGNLGDKLSDNAWHNFDIKYNNSSGTQTISYYINDAVVWTTPVSNPGSINAVQFVQQGGAKPATGENHLMGEMAVGSSDTNCTPPAAPTGIAASPATVCNGASSTLSVNNPGAGLTTDWFTVGCGGTAVAGGTGVNSVSVSPTTTTTYYARTRDPATGCVSNTCPSVTVTIPNCDDGNACTTDTCSDGTCSHTNAANGTACEDGDVCTQNDTCQNAACVSGPRVDPCDTSNGFDTNWLFVIREGTFESQVRKLDGSKLDCAGGDCVADPPVHRPSLPTDRVYHMDLGAWGRVQSSRGQDQSSAGKSITFSNSPRPSNSKVPGVDPSVTPAGSRFFGVYEVNDLGEDTGDVTYSRTSFQIVELNKDGKRVRVMQVGLAANIYVDNTDVDHVNHERDSLTAPHWGVDGDDSWVWTRNNQDGCEPGTIRYNRAKNTIAVATVLGDFGNNTQTLGGATGPTLHPTEFLMGRDPATPAYPRYRVYEFELPEWPEVYYQAGDTWQDAVGHFAPIPAEWVGEPKPVADPSLVRLVQIYELPGNIQAANGRNRNPSLRPSIDFDNNGNMYCTGFWHSAKHPPCWGLYNGNPQWLGDCTDDYRGDVVKVNTLGHRGGRNIYQVPITGPDAANLVVERAVEDALGHTHYWAPTGMTIRRATNELVVVSRNLCGTNCMYTHVFDLNNTVGGAYPCQLVLKKVLSGNTVDTGTGLCRADLPPYWYFQTPRDPYYAQYNDFTGRTYFANFFGDCGGVQNFLVLDKSTVNSVESDTPYTAWGDVGYTLNLPDGGALSNDWDATSPPGPAANYVGACCLPGAQSCQELSQTACYDAGGIWQGKDVPCSQVNCQGACCMPDGTCHQAMPTECTTSGGDPSALGTPCKILCGHSVCPLATCPVPPFDSDCDGDVDTTDFAAFQRCLTTGLLTPPSSLADECRCFDQRQADGTAGSDGAIDVKDLQAFIGCASGPGIPAGACP